MPDSKTIQPEEGVLVRAWTWLTETHVWTSIFRHNAPINDRNRVLVMLSNVFLHLHPVRLKKHGVRLRYTWCMGGLSFFLFLNLTFTGLLLMFYYRPTLEYAYSDIVGLREHVPLGIMREMHRWGAHAMVITVWLHMFRVFMTGSYKPPREFNWNVGVIMLVLTLLLSFTGYLLPWDQLAIWAIYGVIGQRWDGTATSISYHAITEISQYHIMGIMDLRLSIMESKYHIMYHDIHATQHA